MSDRHGFLIIKPKAAKLTRDTELIGKMDPYCLITIGRERFRTEAQKGAGKFPSWREEFKFNRSDEMEIVVEVWDQDSWKSDDLIGTANIPLVSVFQNGKHADWFPLLYKGRSAGQLRVELSYNSVTPSTTQPVASKPNSAAQYFRPIVATTIQPTSTIPRVSTNHPIPATYQPQLPQSNTIPPQPYSPQVPQSYPTHTPQPYPIQAPQYYPTQASQSYHPAPSYPYSAPHSISNQPPTHHYPPQPPQPYSQPPPQLPRSSTGHFPPANTTVYQVQSSSYNMNGPHSQAYPVYIQTQPQQISQPPYIPPPQLTNPSTYLNYNTMQNLPLYPPPHNSSNR
jgi:hypothetical protein